MKKMICTVIATIFIFSGCQPGSAENTPKNGFLQDEELELYTSQFGLPFEEVKKNLGLTEDDLTGDGRGEWTMAETRKIGEMDFSQSLTILDGVPGSEWDGDVYRFDFICREETGDDTSIDDLRERGISLALLAKGTYGEPVTDSGIGDRVFDEDGNVNSEPKEHYIERWQVLENITLAVDISLDDQAMLIYVTYEPTNLKRELSELISSSKAK